METIVKPLENVKKSESLKKSENGEKNKNTLDIEKGNISEDKKELKNEKKSEIKKEDGDSRKEPKLEIITPLKRNEINFANEDPNFQQFPKLEAFENGDGRGKELEEELKKVNAMFDNNQGYDDVVKKSIAEIFKSKPMDVEKRKKLKKV